MNTITDIKEVNELRTLSLNLFNKHGYPTRKDEDWKQSQLNYFLENNKLNNSRGLCQFNCDKHIFVNELH